MALRWRHLMRPITPDSIILHLASDKRVFPSRATAFEQAFSILLGILRLLHYHGRSRWHMSAQDIRFK